MDPDTQMESHDTLKPALEPRLSTLFLLLAAAWAIQRLVPGLYLEYGILALLGGLIALYIIATTLKGAVEQILLGWIVLSPLGYYFFSFPRETPIITFDRAVIALLSLGLIFASEQSVTRIPRSLSRAATAWAVFVLAVLVSFVHLRSFLGAFGLVVDALVLPALMAFYVIRNFDVRRQLGTLHLLMCVVAIYLSSIGLAEMIRGEDLLAMPGTVPYFAGLGNSLLIRPNGPFAATHSFGLVGLLSFCFLTFLRRAIGEQMPRWQRKLHSIGVLAAASQALMTLSRGVVLSLLLILVLDSVSARNRRRMVTVVFAALIVGLLLVLSVVSPAIFEERVTATGNIYARIAQQLQTLNVFWSSPITGVGFSNFMGAAEKLSASTPEFGDVEAMGVAHNNPGAMLADTGLLGFIPYVLSQILLLKAFQKKGMQQTAPRALASRSFLYLFIAYWITGLNVASLYSSDLNLWFLFTTSCVYKYGFVQQSACAI